MCQTYWMMVLALLFLTNGWCKSQMGGYLYCSCHSGNMYNSGKNFSPPWFRCTVQNSENGICDTDNWKICYVWIIIQAAIQHKSAHNTWHTFNIWFLTSYSESTWKMGPGDV
jgi:hypothetical protein